MNFIIILRQRSILKMLIVEWLVVYTVLFDIFVLFYGFVFNKLPCSTKGQSVLDCSVLGSLLFSSGCTPVERHVTKGTLP